MIERGKEEGNKEEEEEEEENDIIILENEHENETVLELVQKNKKNEKNSFALFSFK